MMKVVLICLLSLSVCFGKPADDQAKGIPPAAPNVAPASAPTMAPTVDPTAKPTEVPHEASANATNVPVHPSVTEPAPTAPANVTDDGTPNKTAPKKNDKESKADKSKDEKEKMPAKEDKSTTTTKPPVTEKAATSTTVKPEVSTKPASTVAPHKAAADDDDKHTLKARGFDGASFIGGIILTLGMLAIGLMGFKYYKNQNEREYHTL